MNFIDKIKKSHLEFIEEQQEIQDMLIGVRLEQQSMKKDSMEWKLSNLLETVIIQQGTVRDQQKQIELIFFEIEEIKKVLKK